MKQEMASGNGISWTICKSYAPCSRQITRPALYHSIFYRPDALPDAKLTVFVLLFAVLCRIYAEFCDPQECRRVHVAYVRRRTARNSAYTAQNSTKVAQNSDVVFPLKVVGGKLT